VDSVPANRPKSGKNALLNSAAALIGEQV